MNGKMSVVIRKNTEGDSFISKETVFKKDEIPASETPKNSVITPLLIQYGKQLLNDGTNAYSNLSGDTIRVNRINESLSLVATGIMAISSPLGAIAAGYQTISQLSQTLINNAKANNEAMFLQQGQGRILNNYGRYY